LDFSLQKGGAGDVPSVDHIANAEPASFTAVDYDGI